MWTGHGGGKPPLRGASPPGDTPGPRLSVRPTADGKIRADELKMMRNTGNWEQIAVILGRLRDLERATSDLTITAEGLSPAGRRALAGIKGQIGIVRGRAESDLDQFLRRG